MTADGDALVISPRLTLPREELLLRATRSGGPGGQHVNTSSTRIELVWDVAASPSLDEPLRATLLARLASRLDSRGRLRVVAQEERSQLRNREAALARFTALVAAALVERKRRKATKPTKASQERRVEEKKRRGAVKRERRRPTDD